METADAFVIIKWIRTACQTIVRILLTKKTSALPLRILAARTRQSEHRPSLRSIRETQIAASREFVYTHSDANVRGISPRRAVPHQNQPRHLNQARGMS